MSTDASARTDPIADAVAKMRKKSFVWAAHIQAGCVHDPQAWRCPAHDALMLAVRDALLVEHDRLCIPCNANKMYHRDATCEERAAIAALFEVEGEK